MIESEGNTPAFDFFGWFTLRTGSENMKKTLVFAVHLKPLVEKHRKTQCFLRVR